MKRILSFLFIVIVVCFGFSSCSSDDSSSDESGIRVDNAKLIGEWCSINGNEIMYLNLEAQSKLNNRISYEIGDITTTMFDFAETNGTWAFENGTLRVKSYSSSSGVLKTYDYKISDITEYGFRALQTDIGITYNFSKVIVEKTTTVGESFKFVIPSAYNKFVPASYTSSDSRIAEVDAEGNVKIKKCGTAFIFATNSEGSLVCKVETLAPKQDVIPQHYMTDMFLTLDEFKQQYGSSIVGDIDYSDGTFAFVPDCALFSLCLAYFDTNTGEIYTMYYMLKNADDRAQIGDFLSQVMVAVVNKSGNTVYTNTGSTQDYTLAALFSASESGTLLRFINNKWYSKQ